MPRILAADAQITAAIAGKVTEGIGHIMVTMGKMLIQHHYYHHHNIKQYYLSHDNGKHTYSCLIYGDLSGIW